MSTIKSFPIEYSVTDAALADLAARYKDVPDATTKDGYDAIKIALKELTPLRTGVEKRRKELKADALAYGKKVDEEAKRITTSLLSIETPLKDAKNEVDEAKNRAEEERIARIKMRIESINAYPQTAVGQSSVVIAELITELERTVIDGFSEFYEAAAKAKSSALYSLNEMFDRTIAQEVEAAKIAEQKADIERQKAELEAQRIEVLRMQSDMTPEPSGESCHEPQAIGHKFPDCPIPEPISGWEPEPEFSAPDAHYSERRSLMESLTEWAERTGINDAALGELTTLLYRHGVNLQSKES